MPAPRAGKEILPAWEAVAVTQSCGGSDCWLVAQPDHAALAGDLAANFASPDFPQVDPDAVRAIALHDSGWARLDGGGQAGGGCSDGAPELLRDKSGRPLSFSTSREWCSPRRKRLPSPHCLRPTMTGKSVCPLGHHACLAAIDPSELVDAARALTEVTRPLSSTSPAPATAPDEETTPLVLAGPAIRAPRDAVATSGGSLTSTG